MWEKFKHYISDDAVFYTVAILLVGICSFGLGRMSAEPSTRENTIEIIPPPELVPYNQASAVQATTNNEIGVVVASKSGTKYHLPDCPGAKQIKESNLISFSSIAAAKAAGYTAAANCPGL